MRYAIRRRSAFTLVELMIVVVIVAVLALSAMVILKGHLTSSKMTEGVTAAGTIRTAMRIYSSSHAGAYPTLSGVNGNGLSSIAILGSDLAGKYFTATSYLITSDADSYTIRVTLPGDEAYWYEIDEEGDVTKSNNF